MRMKIWQFIIFAGFQLIGGISFITFIVFMILKLCDAIQWNWWYVTSPLWLCGASVALGFGIAIMFFMVTCRAIQNTPEGWLSMKD